MDRKKNESILPRRIFLQKAFALIPLTPIGASLLSIESSASNNSPTNNSPTHFYTPQFFNDIEWQFVLAASNRLIPPDEYGPGAIDEGVPVFIDKQMEQPYGFGYLWYMHAPFSEGVPELGYQSSLTPRELYRRGIKAVNQWCHNQQGQLFSQLEPAKQDEILKQLESGELAFDSVPGQLFFTQLLENTKEGYLADPIHGGNQTMASWKLIGFPGARADYQQVLDNPGRPYPLGPVSISGKKIGI